ncbi:helix-turn-helix domain-containing protein [Rhizobacter sp. SG703]|uniref:helix-turn-helix transcriptional regulator n=1 Tax=Rhizobacter sp. SG703 TaxID=2587140 RepID=UPI0014480B94|nr:helix-turn-helix domain-containing protein [Rhizobacter sp. SG703]NKI93888.1 putative DNA-binding transcriptional regulator AlpA [Rhizobacter sp. SG703]
MSNLTVSKLVTKADAAAVFDVCTRTIDNYIRDERLPQPVQFGSREYWHPAEFEDFLTRTFRRTSGPSSDHPSTTEELAPAQKGKPQASAPKPRPKAGAKSSDSNAVVRQQARQEARLRALNIAK